MFGQRHSDDGTVVAMLASALRRDIAFGTLRPDEKLKIESLRSRYGGSNHSMRETLRLLSAEGLVEATAQRGFRVTSATQDDLRDIAFVRKEIEKTAIKRAIELGDTSWEARVLGAHHQLRKAEEAVAASPDDLTALEWDTACCGFVTTILEACASPRLLEIHQKYFDQSRRFRLAQLREGRIDFVQRKQQQRALLDAVLNKDTAAAQALISKDIEAELNA